MDEIEEFALEQGLGLWDIIAMVSFMVEFFERECPGKYKKAIREIMGFYREVAAEHKTWESLSEERKEELARKYPNMIAFLVASKLENSD